MTDKIKLWELLERKKSMDTEIDELYDKIDILYEERRLIQKQINEAYGDDYNETPCSLRLSKFCSDSTISDELALFLGKSAGTKMKRTDVTREINKYIMNNHLRQIGDTRKINPDIKLKQLFNLKDEDELTYFNLQRYITPHFI